MAHDPNETRTREDNPFLKDVLRNIEESICQARVRTQVETECARCGEPMCVVRWVKKITAEPDTEPLCETCVDEILHDRFEPDGFDEQPGSRCTSGCAWCGRCS